MAGRSVFISYARHDMEAMMVLRHDIESLGYEIWYDNHITGGSVWWDHILDQIRKAEIIVVAVSAASLESISCQREYRYALALKKPFLPVSIDPDLKLSRLPVDMQELQVINYCQANKQELVELSRALTFLPSTSALPEPLPPSPDIPLSPIADLRDQLRASEHMDMKSQAVVLYEITGLLHEQDCTDEMIDLLHLFQERDDCVRKTDQQLSALLNRHQNVSPVTVKNQPVEPPKPGERRAFNGMPFVWIPAGEFMMGSPESEKNRYSDEKQHTVNIQPGFWMGQCTVTFAQFDIFCKANNRELPDDKTWGQEDRPVINVSWLDAMAYIDWLNQQGHGEFRLPTEAEWEYTARAGSTTAYYTGEKITVKQANFNQNVGETLAVASFEPNDWGLHDMHGNVWEWTSSLYHEEYDGCELKPSHKNDKGSRSVRGGSWDDDARHLRAAYRNDIAPSGRGSSVGFRLVRIGSLGQDC